jgi:hypothetical protein
MIVKTHPTCGFRRSPATHSDSKEATYSDPKPAIIPI